MTVPMFTCLKRVFAEAPMNWFFTLVGLKDVGSASHDMPVPTAWKYYARGLAPVMLFAVELTFVYAAMFVILPNLGDTFNDSLLSEYNASLPEDEQIGQTRLGFSNGVYFIFITFTTIGLGDICPKESHRGAQVIAALAACSGVVIIGQYIDSIYMLIEKRVLHVRARNQLQKELDGDLIATLDADGNGVDKTEFVVGMLVLLDMVSEEDVKPFLDRFDELDKDGSGKLDHRDLAEYARLRLQSVPTPSTRSASNKSSFPSIVSGSRSQTNPSLDSAGSAKSTGSMARAVNKFGFMLDANSRDRELSRLPSNDEESTTTLPTTRVANGGAKGSAEGDAYGSAYGSEFEHEPEHAHVSDDGSAHGSAEVGIPPTRGGGEVAEQHTPERAASNNASDADATARRRMNRRARRESNGRGPNMVQIDPEPSDQASGEVNVDVSNLRDDQPPGHVSTLYL